MAETFQTFEGYENLPDKAKGAVIALGNFDGIHRGHQAVISVAREAAAETDALLGVGLFDPHPMRYFKKDAPPFLLMNDRLRAEVLKDIGVTRVYKIPFTAQLRDMDDTEFVDTVLHKGLGISHVVVGEDYGFGKNRCGNVESLTRLCAKRGIGVTAVSPVGLHRYYGKYGSTQIRDALKGGDVFYAAHMLSRPWTISGEVKTGDKIGRTIGFPTANIQYGDFLRPMKGIYCVEVRLPDSPEWLPAVASSGTRPTVNGTEERLETYIFDFDKDIYGQIIDVRFRTFIRPEEKFHSVELMTAQIEKDAAGARVIFGF